MNKMTGHSLVENLRLRLLDLEKRRYISLADVEKDIINRLRVLMIATSATVLEQIHTLDTRRYALVNGKDHLLEFGITQVHAGSAPRFRIRVANLIENRATNGPGDMLKASYESNIFTRERILVHNGEIHYNKYV